MIWNEEDKRWECQHCGNSEETLPNLNVPNYIR
jgi:hypothetical protein